MKIKISKSQLINILNEEEKNLNLSDKEKFGLFDAGLRALASNSDDPAVAALGDLIISKQLGGSEMSNMNKIDILPLDPGTFRISSRFGSRNIGSIGTKNHQGIDLAVKSGTPVYSVANGVVLVATDTTPDGCGGHIKIEHEGYETKYCHLSRWVVKKGDEVTKAQIIGYTGGGKTDPHHGSSNGPHLHYEVLRNNTQINPSNVHTELS